MRYLNETVTINNASTTTTAALDGSYLAYASAQAVFTDATAAGAFKFQASNDGVHWNDVPNSSQTVATGATTLIPVTQVCYRQIRAAFVSTGGAGTIAITFEAQGF